MVEQIRRRNIGVFVREILEEVRLGTPDFITSAIIGLSTRRHLSQALSAFASPALSPTG